MRGVSGVLHAGSEIIESRNPARPQEVVWRGEATVAALDAAVARARRAFPAWSAAPATDRVRVLERWREVCNAQAEEIARLITREMGKTLEESRAEAKLLGEKVTITLEEVSQSRVRSFSVPLAGGRRGECRFRPYGVMAVIGPFNFPAHLPNGHWVPALMLGNTVVFKPSDKTPAVGAFMGELAQRAGFPAGVFEVVQGGPVVGRALVRHEAIDGVLFTGSWPVGRSILEVGVDRPGRMVALEMGGSNPALVLEDAADPALKVGATGASLLEHAVAECTRSAFTTTGQRCTCTRRIIVDRALLPRFTEALVSRARTLTIGAGDENPAPFMGPLVGRAAREAVLERVKQLEASGARVHLAPRIPDRDGWFLTPAVVELERFVRENDSECFGPLVLVAPSDSLDDAIAQANATDFGLVASVFTANDGWWARCAAEVRVGCINRNCGTAGASGRLPFGGLGRSGNLRPAGAFTVDSCAFPQASLIESGPSAA